MDTAPEDGIDVVAIIDEMSDQVRHSCRPARVWRGVTRQGQTRACSLWLATRPDTLSSLFRFLTLSMSKE
jgi:hypothetical protein